MNWVVVFLFLAAVALVVIFGLVVGVTLYLCTKHVRRLSGEVCPSCGYLRQGQTSDQCPECGAGWGPNARARTPAWVELALVAVVVLGFLLVLPAILLVALALMPV